MEKKKAGLIVGALILAAAVAAIVLNKNKKPPEGDSETKQDGGAETKSEETQQSKPKPKGKPPLQSHAPNNPPAPEVTVPGIKTDDVLASSKAGANLGRLYAAADGVVVYNMASAVAWKARKGELLGIVSESRSVSSGYIVYFMKQGVKYWTRSAHTNVQK